MKKKLLILIVCILFIGTLQAQQKDRHFNIKLLEKGVIDSDQFSPYPDMSIQLLGRNKPRLNLLSIFLSDDAGVVSNAVKFSRTGWLDFNLELLSYYTTDVKFHYIFTGPEFWYFSDEDWSKLRPNTIYQSQLTSFDDWKLGTYKFVILIEIKQLGSGVELVKECNFILY
jgi:hypothetical protein